MRGPRDIPVVIATEANLGVMQFAIINDDTPRLAVQGNDPRLVQKGAAFPTGYKGRLFCRTDISGDPVYRYDADAAAWMLVGNIIDPVTADPASPQEGQIWLRTDL